MKSTLYEIYYATHIPSHLSFGEWCDVVFRKVHPDWCYGQSVDMDAIIDQEKLVRPSTRAASLVLLGGGNR